MIMFFTTSWDDGNKMDLKVAKLLNELNLKATFYIPIHWQMKSLSNSNVKKISRDFEIGSHSFSHRRIILLNKKELEFELTESKKILEKITNKEITSFAYPFGWYNEKTIQAVKKAGYNYARTTKEGNFKKPKNLLLASISLGITNTYINPIKIFLRITNYGGIDFLKSIKKIVDTAKKNEIVHIAGHSWEFSDIENFEKLSNILEYISKKKIKPIANADIPRI
jgi:peptidoglycan/xylan/chitin deacetylase (PgdA/CDA1 family)